MIDFFRLSVLAWLKRGFFFDPDLHGKTASERWTHFFSLRNARRGKSVGIYVHCTAIWENRSPSSTKRKVFVGTAKVTRVCPSQLTRKNNSAKRKKNLVLSSTTLSLPRNKQHKKCQKEKKFDMPEKRWKKLRDSDGIFCSIKIHLSSNPAFFPPSADKGSGPKLRNSEEEK